MAHLAHAAIADLRMAVRERRPVLVVGPARSGLTWLVNQIAIASADDVARVSLRGVATLAALQAHLASALRLSSPPRDPSDLQVALLDVDESIRAKAVIFNDCHRASDICLDWLVRAVIEPAAGMRDPVLSFLLEGAIDPDAVLTKAFPGGASVYPLIHHVEPVSPWRTLSEVDDFLRGRWRPSFTAGLVPWLADITGGDVGFLTELVERLPNDGEIRDETVNAAVRHVLTHGRRAGEIRLALVGEDLRDACAAFCRGAGVPDVVPSALETGPLKTLYLKGVAAFDGVASMYRVRGALTAQIVAEHVGMSTTASHFERRFMLCRLSMFFAHIASFELDLRSALRRDDALRLAREVTTETGLGDHARAVKAAVVRVCAPNRDQLPLLTAEIKKALPESMPVLDSVRQRLGAEPGVEELLENVTFAQLARMVQKGDMVAGVGDAMLSSINEYRNAFAHFRAEPYGRCVELLRLIGAAQRTIKGR
ncbi:MAG: hypothetical protein KBG48_08845 [Kofleriaceae bacterium]|nr:hypothetical protein [Kofleriaceae bacterium]MBP9167481.1 hypothetical protein [Kofleriaceae bacterium]MBP9861029.1 hypothetical protein [Kofleriaceae bacterium]